jgi:hypothetical protein
MKTLIVTNSLDATVDFIINEIGSSNFVRINYDRPLDWVLNLSKDTLSIKSEVLGFDLTDNAISKFIWRKPYISDPQEPPYNDKFYKTEWKFFLHDIMLFFRKKGRVFLNEPLPDFLFTKHYQLSYASNYFACPPMFSSINAIIPPQANSIAKGLSSTTFENGNVFYTTDISGEELDSALWTIQEKVDRTHDLTVAYVYGKVFAFELDRNLFDGLDWRTDVFEVSEDWKFIELDTDFSNRIIGFMTELSLNYGRLDFLANANGADAVFLEVNRNGQWAWLDQKHEYGLFDAMCDVYRP